MHRTAPTVKNDLAQGASRIKVRTPLWGQATWLDGRHSHLLAGGLEDHLMRQVAPFPWAALTPTEAPGEAHQIDKLGTRLPKQQG